MRKLLLFLLISTLLIPSAFASPDESDGFRGIKWETNLHEVVNQFSPAPVYSDKGVTYYARKDDELKLGSAALDKIVYGFWQEKLYRVELSYTGYNNFIGVKDVATARFGQPEQPYRSTPVFFWNGFKVGVLLNHYNLGQTGKLVLYSKALDKEKERQDKERAKTDAAKGF